MTTSTDNSMNGIKPHPNDLITCADGVIRPRWASRGALSWRYFDEEWGRPPGGESGWFGAVTLVVFQLGLAWHAVLSKCDALRAAFAMFHVKHVAAYDEHDVERLLADPTIFRNRRKIGATITNARALEELAEPFGKILATYGDRPFLADDGTVPTSAPASVELARELRELGFAHIGSTAAFALMQATGVIPIRAHYDLKR